jgi:L-iditol 2-dehydrogenase
MVTHGVGNMSMEAFPYPPLDPDGMIVRVGMVGVCGTDPHQYQGKWDCGYPIIQGHETMGVVAEIGERAHERMNIVGGPLKPGDRVTWYPNVRCGTCWYCQFTENHCESPRASYGLRTLCDKAPHLFGGFAEYICLVPNTWVFKVPDSLTDEEAALANIFTIPVIEQCLQPSPSGGLGFQPLNTVVVQGSGPVGLAATFRAKAAGAGRVIMIGAPSRRLEWARRFGADETIDIGRVTTEAERIGLVREMCDGRGADLVVECVGSPRAIIEGLQMLRRGGTYYEIGNTWANGGVELIPSEHLMKRQVRLLTRWGSPQQYDFVLRLFATYRDRFPFVDLVTHKFPLERARDSFDVIENLEAMKAVVYVP